MKELKQVKTSSKILVGGLIAVCLIVAGISFKTIASQGSLEDKIAQIAGSLIADKFLSATNDSVNLGYVGDSPTYLTDKRSGTLAPFSNAFIADDFEVADDSYFGGDMSVYGQLGYVGKNSTITATTTLSIANSGTTYYLSGSYAQITLPATTTAGTTYRFVVGGAITGAHTVVTAGGLNAIDGTLIVAGAVVDCDAEDTITFVADGENVGDFFEIYTNGTSWFLGASGGLTASKLTCTAS